MEIDKDFNLCVGLRIREVRETFQMTQAEFSERCDISESFLAAVEGGKKGITSKTIFKICTSMNISSDYLIFGKKNGFEFDSLTELVHSMDKDAAESAIRILREYVYAINHIQEKYAKEGLSQSDKKSQSNKKPQPDKKSLKN